MSAVPAPDTGPDAGAVWHYGDPLGEQRAAQDEAVVVDRSHRAALTLTGSERRAWLHNISTQHVSDLPDGAVTQNLSLDGQGVSKITGSRPSSTASPTWTPSRGAVSSC